MSEERRTVQVRVFRFNPSVDGEPRYEVYAVPFIEGQSVSNALQHINEEYDGGLAHYLSCRRGICAECMVRVNGRVVLACTELVRGDITVEPVKKDRVVKDLVTMRTRPEGGSG